MPERQPARQSSFAAGWRLNNPLRWGFAAGLVVCLGLAAMFLYERIDPSGTTSLRALLYPTEGDA